MLPIVLASGQLLTRDCWAPQLDAWAGRDVVVADHRQDDSIAGMADRLLAAAPERFALVAHAMGGFVAFEVMRRMPARVAKLVLLATLATADGPAQTARRQGYIDLVEQGRFDDVIEERIPLLLAPAHRGDPALVAIARKMAAETGADVFMRQQRALMARVDSRLTLPAIDLPVLLLWGEGDGITTRAQQDEMLALLPRADLRVLSGAGHLLTLERPAATTQAIDGFLA